MVQRMYRGIKTVDPEANVTVATSRSQVSAIHNQIGTDVGVSVEPMRKDTFPAIALASAYLHDVQNISKEEAAVICPVDPYVENDYFAALGTLCQRAQESSANLVLMGIAPTYPSEKYGYIIPKTTDRFSEVSSFKEKPDAETAAQYICKGALWNGGVFAFKLGYVLDKARELLGTDCYEDLYSGYSGLKKISFDYAVVEKEPHIEVLRFNGIWKDLGTWNTLAESMSESSIGKVFLSDSCENTNVVNELDVPVVVMGIKNAVIAASPEGVLVSDKTQSSYIKPIVDRIDQQVMFAEKSWGSFRVVDVNDGSLTIHVTLMPGHRMNYHSHERRDEIWNIISGTGTVIVDGMEQKVKPGDVVTMAAGTRHTIIADGRLEVIEVQIGREISVRDKIKYELEV